MDIFLNVTLEDLNSVGSGKETQRANECLSFLEESEPDIGKSEHRFWSGMEARSQKMPGTKSDTDYPFLRQLFEMCQRERQRNGGKFSEQMTLASFMISSCFAYFSRGTAHVFLSSDKATEEAGLTKGTNFMEAELPVLQRLKRTRKIQNILVYRLVLGAWQEPQEIADKIFDVPVWRRKWHPMDDKETKESFVRQKMSQKEWDEWRCAPPRESCSWKTLQKIFC